MNAKKLLLMACVFLAPLWLVAQKNNVLKVMPIRAWHEYKNRSQSSEQSIVLCCKLFIHRRGNPLKLKHLRLQWQPDTPNTPAPKKLIPALYRTKHKTKFKPISQNLITSGLWDHANKSIRFNLNKKLIGKHYLYIVVHVNNTIPVHKNDTDADLLRKGRFVYSDDLPLGTTPIAIKG